MAKSLQIRIGADLERLQRGLTDAKFSLTSFEKAATQSGVGLKRMTEGFSGSKLISDANTAAEAYRRLATDGIGLTATEQKRLNAIVTEGIAKYQAMGREAPEALRAVKRETDGAAQGASKLSGLFGTAAGALAAFGIGRAVLGGVSSAISAVGSAAFGMNASLESTTLQFQTLIGDADGAREHVRSLFNFAKSTPFETGPVIEASRALRVFGGSALDTQANLRLVGDAAAATGAPINEVGTWVGRLYANLKAGKPIGEAAQRLTELAVLGPESRAALEQVAAGAGTIEQKFGVAQQALGKFSGAMDLQAKSWQGVMSSLSDAVNMTVADAFRGLFEVVRDTMGRVVTILGDEGVSGALAGVGQAITGAFGTDQRAAVDGMTAAFVGVGQGAVTAASVAVRAWGAASYVVLGFLSVAAEMDARRLEVLGRLSSATSEEKAAAASARQLADTLHAQRTASFAASQGQSALVQSLEKLRGELGRAGTAAKVESSGPLMFAASLATWEKGAGTATGKANGLGKAFGDLGGKTKGARTEYERWIASLTPGVVAANQQVNAINALVAAYKNLGGIAGDAKTRGGALGVEIAGGERFGNIVSFAGVPGTSRMAEVGGLAARASLAGFAGTSNQNTINRPRGTDWGALLSSVPSQIVGVFSQGGGGRQVGGGLGSVAGGVAGSWAGGAASTLAKAGAGLLSSGASTALSLAGNVLPVLGPILGGALGKWIGGMFGPSEGKKAANLREDYVAKLGGADAFNQQFRDAGVSAEQARSLTLELNGAKSQKDVEATIGRINALIERNTGLMREQAAITETVKGLEAERAGLVASLVPSWSTLQGILEKYKIDAAGLGATFNQIGTTASFKTIIDDLETVKRAGGDVGGTLVGMKQEISAAVNEAKRLGTEVPENIRAYAEELARSGQLLDENGEAITDVNAAFARLKDVRWGAAVETEQQKTEGAIAKLDASMERFGDRLLEIVDLLANRIPAAAEQGARGAQNAFDGSNPQVEPGRTSADDPRAHAGALVTALGLRRFHSGGLAANETAAILEAGEMVLSRHTVARLSNAARSRIEDTSGGGGGGGYGVANLWLDGDLLTSVVLRRTRRVLHAHGVAA